MKKETMKWETVNFILVCYVRQIPIKGEFSPNGNYICATDLRNLVTVAKFATISKSKDSPGCWGACLEIQLPHF